MSNIRIKQKKNFLVIITFILTGLLIGCGNNSTSPTLNNFSLSIQKDPNSPGASASDTLNIDTVKIMLKNVELFSDSLNYHEEHEDSEEVEIGPFVVNLNLNGSLNTIALTDIPAGTYRGVKFEIHRLNRNEAVLDSEFIDSTCGQKGYSVIVKGTYFDSSFVYKSRKSFHQRVIFPAPITVTDNGMINVTLTVDPYTWFYKDGTYLDPNDYNNHWMIDKLIRNSFNTCFKDNDRNGDPDH